MKTLILLLLPFLGLSQEKKDTLPAILKLQRGNYTTHVKGKVVLTKDCRVVEYLRVNTWRRKEKLLHFDDNVTVAGYVLFKTKHHDKRSKRKRKKNAE